MKSKHLLPLGAALCSLFTAVNPLLAQGTGFTYQGRLTDNGSPANGNYDLQFYLRDAPTAGNPAGTTNTLALVLVSNGLFAVTLDFGAGVFTGPARWLEIGVRTNGSVAAYSILSPRQALTPSPYAIFATTSGTASNVVNGSVVQSLNGLKDIVTLAAGTNMTITPNGNTLTLAAAGAGGSGIWSVNGNNAYYNAGNVGIGTAAPSGKLTVATSDDTAPGLVFAFDARHALVGTPSAGLGLSYSASTGAGYVTAVAPGVAFKDLVLQASTLRFNPSGGTTAFSVLNNGNVGIGSATPVSKLDIVGAQDALSLIGYEPFLTFKDTGANNALSRVAGGNGDVTLQTASYIASGNPANGFLIVRSDTGNVGIGTGTPVAQLHVETGATKPAVYGHATGAATGVQGQSSTGIGVYAYSVSGTGVYGRSTTGIAVYAEGNAAQAQDKRGFVKAMVYVDSSAAIIRCYNGVTGSSTGGCGFTVTQPLSGVYRINFGFPVSGRFVSVTAEYDSYGGFSGNKNAGANYRFFDSTSVEVFTFQSNVVDAIAPAKFMIIMY
jgi:hypothetical protein